MQEDYFDRVESFKDLSAEQRNLLRPLFTVYNGDDGDVLFEQEDAADNLYILLDGEVVIRYKPEDGPAISVARVRPEGVIGWSAVLGKAAYTSSAICSTQCSMLRMCSMDLRALCVGQPETGALLLERLAAMIGQRLRRTQEQAVALLEQGVTAGVRGY